MTRTMTRYLFIFIALLSFQRSRSQVVFCPPGAEWHYLESGFNFAGYFYNNIQVKYVRDSVLGPETVKVVEHNRLYVNCNPGNAPLSVLKQKGDTVFIRNVATQHLWQILYNYAALPGQSWTTRICSNTNSLVSNYTVTVDSANYSIVNGFTLKNIFAKVNYAPPSGFGNIQITERIGPMNIFLLYFRHPDYQLCQDSHSFIGRPLCYQDNTFGLKQFAALPCDYSSPVGIKENNYQNSNIKIYPNPSNDFFTINTENEMLAGESIVSINDLSGRAVKQINLNNLNSEKINIAALANGVYILNVKTNNAAVYTGKLVKVE